MGSDLVNYIVSHSLCNETKSTIKIILLFKIKEKSIYFLALEIEIFHGRREQRSYYQVIGLGWGTRGKGKEARDGECLCEVKT